MVSLYQNAIELLSVRNSPHLTMTYERRSPFLTFEFKSPCFEKYTQQLLGWQRVSFKLLAGPLGIWAREL